jgi:Ca2+-binding RTX toxin-like protein
MTRPTVLARCINRLSGRLSSSARHRRHETASPAAAAVESLEGRVMPAATISLINSMIYIDGTNDPDSIYTDYATFHGRTIVQAQVFTRGVRTASAAFWATDVQGIVVRAWGGSDYAVNNTSIRDYMYGGWGNDYLVGGWGQSYLNGGFENDILDGRGGNDTVYGEEGNDTLWGGAGADWLDGWKGNDVLYGQGENDVLIGSFDNDSLVGGAGNDWMNGGDGSDALWGQDGHDTLYGGWGNDYLDGGTGYDSLFGDAGWDTLIYNPWQDVAYQ